MKGDLLNKDTIIAPITALSGGSVHLLRVSGANAVEITKRFFSNKKIDRTKKNRFFYGRFVNEQNKLIDDVILLVFKKPNSYTGEDVVEISCHANILITEQIIGLYLRNGCRLAEPGEFTKRAFLNGKLDLVQAESIAALIAARSKKALENALNQLEGKFSAEIKEIKKNLIKALSLLELNLDFSEEDIEIIGDDQILEVINDTINRIERYLKSYNQGRLLLKGIKVLITGKPNVGKSSLMNALLERDRVLVSEIPGTTRDVVHDEIYLDNILVKFLDTAGIRYSGDSIEQEGVKRAKQLYRESDIIIMLFDVSQELDKEDFYLLEIAKRYDDKIIFVGNKTDIGFIEDNEKYFNEPLIKISAKHKNNINLIKEKIKNKIHLSEDEDVFINNERQLQVLKDAQKGLKRTKKVLKDRVGHEFVAMELKQVVDSLSVLTGEITNEDILNNIFSNFCIGK